jgi:hypothetical protein
MGILGREKPAASCQLAYSCKISLGLTGFIDKMEWVGDKQGVKGKYIFWQPLHPAFKTLATQAAQDD